MGAPSVLSYVKIRRLHSHSRKNALQGSRGFAKNKDSYALGSCGNEECLSGFKQIQARTESGAQPGIDRKCRSIGDAHAAFVKSEHRNVFSWNALITAYARNGHHREVIELFHQMDMEGVLPNQATFISVLGACASLKALSEGREVHGCILAGGFRLQGSLGNTLVNMYGKCGSLVDARCIFDTLRRKDVVSWNAMISAYAQHRHSKEALELYHVMDVKPNKVTFISVLSAISGVEGLSDGKAIHKRISATGLEADVVVSTSLISMYGKCEDLNSARDVFEKMQSRNVVTWTVMISAYSQHSHGKEALELFMRMDVKADGVTFISALEACSCFGALEEGRKIHARIVGSGLGADIVAGNALINMYGKCGSLDEARSVFDKMHKRTLVSWNSMVAAYAQHGEAHEALRLYQRMDPEGMEPDEVTFASILNACSSMGAFVQGKEVHARVAARGCEGNLFVGNALVDMYGKCGELDTARSVFNKMLHRDVVTYTSIISAYAMLGHLQEALELHRKMEPEGVEPDRVTFISLLGACSTVGSLLEGRELHARIVDSGLETDVMVATSLINMYGKCGDLEKARSIFCRMLVKNVVSWNAMIAAYAQNGCWSNAFELYQKMDSEGIAPNEVTHSCVLDACSSMGVLAEGKLILAQVLARGLDSSAIVASALIRMYGRFGELEEARMIFDKMQGKSVSTYNVMVAAYAQHGYGREALQVYQGLLLDGERPDKVTVVSVLFGCSHVGLMQEAWRLFLSMEGDHSMAPAGVHYACMVDMLGRAGRLEEAEELIQSMPFEPGSVEWMALLSGCGVNGDVERGKAIAERVLELDAGYDAPYIMLSNIYAAQGEL